MSIVFLMTCLFQPQAIDSYIVNVLYFPSSMAFFQAIMHSYQQCFGISD